MKEMTNNDIDKAKELLVHYFCLASRGVELRADVDHFAEIEEIIDSIVAVIEGKDREILDLKKRMDEIENFLIFSSWCGEE